MSNVYFILSNNTKENLTPVENNQDLSSVSAKPSAATERVLTCLKNTWSWNTMPARVGKLKCLLMFLNNLLCLVIYLTINSHILEHS